MTVSDAAIAQANELMACPFCGGADIRQGEDDFGWYQVYCTDCGGGMEDSLPHKAIAAWNRRTPPAQAAEAVDDDEPPTCPICDCGHFFGRCSDCGFIAPAALNSDMAGALAILANYPVEDFGLEEASDSYGLIGANEWRLTLGDVRKARAAIAAMQAGE